MTIRALNLPKDLAPLEDILVRTFQYPDNPEWGIQADEEDDFASDIKSLRRLWPLFRLAQIFSKPMRDLFRGFVWEEDGKIGAVVFSQRRGSSATWTIGTVGVLPDYRRRGLARKLLTRTLQDIRQRGGKCVNLSVIDRNVPAYALYKSLGFEHYSSQIKYMLTPTAPYPHPPMPADYTPHDLDRFDWQKRYDLAKRITPPEVAKYHPLDVGRFKDPVLFRAIIPLLDRIQKRTEKSTCVHKSGILVGYSGYRTTSKPKGTSKIWVELDPKHPELAAYIAGAAVSAVTKLSPTLRVQFSVSAWMPALLDAAEEAGFVKRLEYHLLGLVL